MSNPYVGWINSNNMGVHIGLRITKSLFAVFYRSIRSYLQSDIISYVNRTMHRMD